MVGYDNRSEKLTSIDFVTAGALSSFITRALCQPFDVLKIRFQLQVEPIKKKVSSKYQSLPQALFVIYKDEGIKAFWKGHVPAQYLSVTYGLTQFYLFEILTKQIDIIHLHKTRKALGNFICGAIAGGAATVASFPFDVVRTRLVAQGLNCKEYSGICNAFKKIYLNEGPRVLFRGLTPTFIQVAPHAGVQFMCYKFFDGLYRTFVETDKSSYTFVGSTLAGSLSGLVAKVFIYPLDLMKKRLQIQGFKGNRNEFGKKFVCRNMFDGIFKIYSAEGILGLFKGLSPSLFKAVVTTALHFNTYELICKVLIQFH